MAVPKDSPDTVTQKTTTEPWSESKPYQLSLMGEAAYGYQNGLLAPSPYPGSTYVGPTSQELSGLQQMEQLAGQGNPLVSPTMNFAENMISQRGITADQTAAMEPIQAVAQGQNAIGTGSQYQDVYSGLNPMASGSMIGESNPYIMDALDTAAQEAGDAVNSSMAGAGRYGSDVHQETLGETVGNIYSTGLSAQVNQDIANQLNAVNAQMGALGGATGVEGANIANQVGSAQALNNIYGQGNQLALQTASMAPQFDEMRYSDANKMVDVGAAYRGELQAELADQVNRYNAESSQYYNNLNAYNSLINGVASPYSATTATVPQGSPINNALGTAATAAGLMGTMGVPSPYAIPITAAAGMTGLMY